MKYYLILFLILNLVNKAVQALTIRPYYCETQFDQSGIYFKCTSRKQLEWITNLDKYEIVQANSPIGVVNNLFTIKAPCDGVFHSARTAKIEANEIFVGYQCFDDEK